jgi:PAS domain S-box-containing protein
MESELTRVIDALPGLVWTALPDGYLDFRIDFFNRRWCEYTGLAVDEAYGTGWQTAIHPDDLPELLECWRFLSAAGEPGEMEARLRRFDGDYRRFLIRMCPLADASGQIVKWCGMNMDIEDRRRSEDALRETERRFRLIVDGLPTLVALSTADLVLDHANHHYLEYFGAPLDELKARGAAHSCHPDDSPGVLAARKEALKTGQPYEIDARRRRADGVYRWFHLCHFPLRDAQGRIVLWCLLQTDIDERRRAEALLAGEKRLLEMVADGYSMPGILETLCQLVESTATGCYCSVMLVDTSGTRLEDGVAPSLPASFIDAVNGRPVSVDSGPCAMAAYLNRQVITADIASETRWAAGSWCPMALAHGLRSCWSTPISSAAGKVLGAFAIYYAEPRTPTVKDQALINQFTHIASIAIERTKGQAALRRSEAFLVEAQRISSTGSFSWRMATDEITWSEQVYRIFELDPDLPVTLELIGSRHHPEDVLSMREMVERARAGKDFEYEHRLLMPDGSIKYLHTVAHVTRDRDGQLEYIGAVHDVTQRRLSEEALGRVQSELAHMARVTSLGALTASIAHEVNQPLSGIITNASTCLRMLAADPPNVDGARETARRTIRDGNRASDVITRLRALFSKKNTTSESVDLNEATREVIALSRKELQRSGVILRPELADDLPAATGDRVQLQQVILNLLLNASDAMSDVNDRPRQLVIRTERDEGDRVRLTVQDAGVGVEPQGVDKLFEAFYTTKSSGMGIGLSVSRSIIESHHGRLWATPNEGPGAAFSFSIPCGPEGVTVAHSLDAIRAFAESNALHVTRNR